MTDNLKIKFVYIGTRSCNDRTTNQENICFSIAGTEAQYQPIFEQPKRTRSEYTRIRGDLYITMDKTWTKRRTPRTKEEAELIRNIPRSTISHKNGKCGGNMFAPEHLKCTQCHSFPYIIVLDEGRSKKYNVICLERHYLDDPTELVRQIRDRPDMIKYTTGNTSDDSDDSKEEEDVACSQKK